MAVVMKCDEYARRRRMEEKSGRRKMRKTNKKENKPAQNLYHCIILVTFCICHNTVSC
jgi:hypothetical protein